MSPIRYLLIRFGRLMSIPVYRRIAAFRAACADPEPIQTALLHRILQRQAVTGFGRDHHFADIRTIADYRRQVPIAPYEYVAPYIDRVANGETDALIADDQVLLFALTSGTTAARKLIPVTRRYLADYQAGWNMWGAQAFKDHRPRSLGFRPIVQMVGDPAEHYTAAGIPCGNLSGFTANVQWKMIRKMYTVPAGIGKVTDTRARYYLALRLSIGRPCALFTAANPSTLIALGRTLDAEKDALLKDLYEGTLRDDLPLPDSLRAAILPTLRPDRPRAIALRRIAEATGTLLPKDIWPPESILIGTWTGGSMGPYLRQLPKYFGEPAIRDLGLLASEGRMTVPFADHTPVGVLDIFSHYFEFIPEAGADSQQPTVLGAHELVDGQSYFIVPTTASGLYRYQISDLIRVRGFLGKTPMVEFLGKGNRFSNLTGEKLSEHHVTQAVELATLRSGVAIGGYTVAPVWDETRPYYGLYVEEPDAFGMRQFLPAFENALHELNIEYAAKRSSDRLGPARGFIVPVGTWQRWDRARLATTRGSLEQYKHPCLIADTGFGESLPGVRAG